MIFATAMMLQCYFNPSTGSGGDIPVIKVPLTAEYAETFAAQNPPLNKTVFVGESESRHEWIIGNSPDPTAQQMKLLRVRISQRALASPFDARFGTASKQADQSYTFTEELTGYCDLKPAQALTEIAE